MKKDEVPQDKALFGEFHEVAYAIDEEGNYVAAKSKGWDPKIVALSQYWKMVEEDVQDALRQIREGDRSNILYFMVLSQMDIGLLASYVGLSKWRVKRHLKKKHFEKLSPEVLQRYAEIFEVSMEVLKSLPEDPQHPECISKWANLRD